MNRGAARPWIIMALIFLLGAITGSLLTIGFGPHFGPPGPQDIGNHWMHYLVWRLHLTGDQQAKIEPIIRQAEDRIQAKHREDVASISAIMQDANASMKPYLNADQQTELQHMESERERMFENRMHGHRGWGHPDADKPPSGPPPGTPAPPGA